MRLSKIIIFSFALILALSTRAYAQDNGNPVDEQYNQGLPFPEDQGAFESLPIEQQAVVSGVQENKISLDIKGMDIIDVLKMISSRSAMNMIIGKNVTGRVTLFLKEVDIWDAFEIILLANDLAYEKKGSIINVMTQRDYELLHGERFQDQKQAKIIQLKYAKAAELSKALNQIKTNVGKIVIDEGSNTIVMIDSAQKIKEMEDFIKNTDLKLSAQVFNLNYAQADKLSAKIQELLTKGVGSLKIDERTNKIAVTDYPEKLEEIGKIISAFDEKTPQVLIDAQIVEISPDKDEFSMGVDWDYWLKNNVHLISPLPAPALTSAATIGTKLAFGIAAKKIDDTVNELGQYKSIVDMLRVIGQTKILSSPRIMVLNNQEARILVGTKDAYITSTTSQGGSGNTVTSQSVNFVDVGIKLYVTPTINRDGYVTLKVKPEISSSTRTTITSQGTQTQIPIVSTSETETTIMIKDGTTIIIAGLKKNKREKEVKKIPFFGDIPVLGLFLRNTKDEVNKTELVIFITPHIVSGDEPLDYVSLTKDKDIARLQNEALARSSMDKSIEQASAGDYQQMVIDKIKKSSESVKHEVKNLKGKVEVSFVLLPDGKLKEEPRIASADNLALGKIAVQCVKNASPFPPFPASLKKPDEMFKIDLVY